MSIIAKIKKFLGIGGAKMVIDGLSREITMGETLDVTLKVVGNKEVEEISGIVAQLKYKRVKKSGNKIKTRRMVLDEIALPDKFKVGPGQEKVLNFKLKAALPEDGTEQGGLLGAAHKVGKFLSDTKEYVEVYVTAESSYAKFAKTHMFSKVSRG